MTIYSAGQYILDPRYGTIETGKIREASIDNHGSLKYLKISIDYDS